MKPVITWARVEFSALGGRYEKFITRCGEEGIPLQRTKPVVGGVTASMPARQYRKAAKLAWSCRTKLRVLRRRGLYFRLRRYKGRYGLLLAPAVFFVSLTVFGNMVWAVRWQGVEKNWQPMVRSALYSMDIGEGSFLTQEKIRSCEKQLVNQLPQLSWASLNFAKGRLVVEAAPARPKPKIEPNDPVDLVAQEDGIVLKAQVEEGILQKKPGETFAKGEVLISAGRPDRDGRMIPTHAKGKVLAQMKKTYQCMQPLSLAQTEPSGALKTRKTLCVGAKRISLSKEKEPIPKTARINRRPLTVWGFALPATIEEALWTEMTPKQVELSKEAAAQRARLACLEQLYAQFPDAQILDEQTEYTCEEGRLSYRITLQFTANVAKMPV